MEQNNSELAAQGLDALRGQIDSIDNQLIDLLSQRLKVCNAVGEYKKQHRVAVVQSNRYHELVERLCQRGLDGGLNENFVRKIMDVIHEESVKQQNALIGK